MSRWMGGREAFWKGKIFEFHTRALEFDFFEGVWLMHLFKTGSKILERVFFLWKLRQSGERSLEESSRKFILSLLQFFARKPGGKEEEKPTLPHVKLQVEGLENALLVEEEEEEEEWRFPVSLVPSHNTDKTPSPSSSSMRQSSLNWAWDEFHTFFGRKTDHYLYQFRTFKRWNCTLDFMKPCIVFGFSTFLCGTLLANKTDGVEKEEEEGQFLIDRSAPNIPFPIPRNWPIQ